MVSSLGAGEGKAGSCLAAALTESAVFLPFTFCAMRVVCMLAAVSSVAGDSKGDS